MKKGKINNKILDKREKYLKWIKTDEDWYPSHRPLTKHSNPRYNNPLDHMALTVQFFPLLDSSAYRVCIWGGDDFGMELDQSSRLVALEMYELIGDFTTKRDLLDLGFVWA